MAAVSNACTNGGPTKTFDVSAISIDMPLNRFGDYDKGAFMYVLNSRIDAVTAQLALPLPDRVSPGLREDAVQPLIIRANLGDCVIINFTNTLNSQASMHIHGLSYSASDAGGATGNNPNTFAAPKATVTYKLATPTDPAAEGAYYIHDHGKDRALASHGLFGALILEPAGSVFLDPQTGQNLNGKNNWEAIIQVASGVNFREDVIIYHEIGSEDFTGIRDRDGNLIPQVDGVGGVYRPAARALNYRSEPFRNRLLLHDDESQGYGSYMFGDPATPTPFSYLGDPTKTRILHGGSELFHVHHLHGGGDRWRRNPKAEPSDFATGLTKVPLQNVKSTRLDSQALGPGTAFNIEDECGAGGCQRAAGDFLFHCHIQNHYIAGMWAFWRVFDTAQPNLAQIPNRPAPPTSVTSLGLLGKMIEGKTVVMAKDLVDPTTQRSLESWVGDQLPPPGARFSNEDATVWDWIQDPNTPGLFLSEADDTQTWADYASATPGQRHPIMFNPNNGRYAWPLMRPHLGVRPPFASKQHGGAPWLGQNGSALRPDGLCPSTDVVPGRNIRQYPISYVQTPIQMTPTATDPNGMIFMLSEDKQAILADSKRKKPLVIRSNVGDCVNILLTNDVPDNAGIIGPHSKVNMHTHFVQFDPQGSDGVISGLSFEQSVRPYASESRTLVAATDFNATSIQVTNVTNLRPGVAIGVGLGLGMCAPPGGGDKVPCAEIRNIAAVDAVNNVLTLDAPLTLAHASGESVGVEFVQYRWYSDVDFGTVFWHDHITVGGWSHGTFGSHIVEPAGSTYHDPVSGAEIRSGTIADIHTPANASVGTGQSGSFRELYLGLSDAVSGLKDGVDTEIGGTVNLRADPLANRTVNTQFNQAFSSVRFGDPVTPVARAYVGDPFVIRGLGAVEFVGALHVSGHRFRLERFAADGALSDTAPIGISERFDLVLDGGAGGTSGKPGDYLYYSSLGRMLNSGAWGIIRVHDTAQDDLQPLPGHTPPTGVGFPQQKVTHQDPTVATGPGDPCPASAPGCCATPKHYEVTIAHSKIQYDSQTTDNRGVAYTVSSGNFARPTTVTSPLALRVNNGECLEINLTNNLEAPASINLAQLPFDPQSSYGAAVGFNQDSTTPPGKSRLYRFYADRELGTTVLVDLADPTVIARGAYGAVVVEPTGSVYKDSVTGAALTSGVQASVITPQGRFREYVTLFSDEDPIIGHNTMPYPTAVSGSTGINYSAESFADRLANGGDDPLVFNSAAHGDPRLVALAHTGDPFIFRVAQPWGEQAHVFSVEGHQFPMEPNMPGSEQNYSRYLLPGYSLSAVLTNGAGGVGGGTGDYLFLDHRQPFLEAGLWGLFRVLPPGDPTIKALPNL
jgi:FtsP/CotA-like multicopper oxidase with cupredoxin domain